MYCSKCGNEVAAGVRFCTNCGAAIEGTPTSGELAVQESEPSQKEPVPNQLAGTAEANAGPRTKTSFVVAVSLGGVVACVLGFVLVLYIVKPPIGVLAGTSLSSMEPWQTASQNSWVESTGNTASSSGFQSMSAGESEPGYVAPEDLAGNAEDIGGEDNEDEDEQYEIEAEYIFPYSDSEYLTEDDLEGYTDDELCRGMNEIWARHGRKFKNRWLQRYFNKQDWYEGTIAAGDFNSTYKGTDVENENAELINDLLLDHGYDVNEEHPNG